MAAVLQCARDMIVFWLVVLLLLNGSVYAAKKKKKSDEGSVKIGKNVLDYNELDAENLLDQWNENDEDDDPEDKYDDGDPRKPKPTMSQFDPSKFKDDPRAFMKLAKKGKTVMMFVGMAGNPSHKETDKISERWQTSLHNAHLQVQRFIVANNRVMFLLKDGSIAWDVKDYLVTQPECQEVEFEREKFPCAGREAQKSEL